MTFRILIWLAVTTAIFFGNAATGIAQDSVAVETTSGKSTTGGIQKTTQPSLKQLLENSRQSTNYVPASVDDVAAFETLLQRTLKAGNDWQQTKDDWTNLHWNVDFIAKDGILVITEAAGHRSGRGMFAFRINSDSKMALQAPHRFYDSLTGIIARKIFHESNIRAVAWNTVHRKKVDIAHDRGHYINAFSRVVVAMGKDMTVAQLHGFSTANKTGAAKTAEVIISDSTKHPGRRVRQATLGLKELRGRKQVLLYPLEVGTLGGTTNSQAASIYATGASGFLHIEMNADFRKQLTRSASLRSAFTEAISD